MKLNDALIQIAQQIGVPSHELIAYADENTYGGYHSDAARASWPMGSIWEVEGQVLYALVRALKPALCVELGHFYGCGGTHIAAALHRNDHGRLITVDKDTSHSRVPEELRERVTFVDADIDTYELPACDFVFEDVEHTAQQVQHVWEQALKQVRGGGVIVSHDILHFAVGAAVSTGIIAAGAYDTMPYLIEPSDCGLGIYVQPKREGEEIETDDSFGVAYKEAVRLANNAQKARERRAAKKAEKV